jgi:hypothetical protein
VQRITLFGSMARLHRATISAAAKSSLTLELVPGCKLDSKGNLCAIRWTSASRGRQH